MYTFWHYSLGKAANLCAAGAITCRWVLATGGNTSYRFSSRLELYTIRTVLHIDRTPLYIEDTTAVASHGAIHRHDVRSEPTGQTTTGRKLFDYRWGLWNCGMSQHLRAPASDCLQSHRYYNPFQMSLLGRACLRRYGGEGTTEINWCGYLYRWHCYATDLHSIFLP